jgi:inner membrane protein
MDSVTQAVLGATVCDAFLGKRLGRKATWWGLGLGTLPDLDVLLSPWLTQRQLLHWHRGWSHGVLVMLIGSVLIFLLMKRIHGERVPRSSGLAATFSCWSTHVLIDSFTVYGTGVWEPFSQHWIALNNLFIIDPVYTTPLILATLASAVCAWNRGWRTRLTRSALLLSSLYVIWSMAAKYWVDQRFEDQMNRSGMIVQQWQSSPTPLNTLLWRCLVKSTDRGQAGFWIGYASLLDKDDRVHWRWVGQGDLPTELAGKNASQTVQWFSQGYWVTRTDANGTKLSDLRFGEMTLASKHWDQVEQPWIFSWRVIEDGEGLEKLNPIIPIEDQPFLALWNRVMGKRFVWER